ncbi:MAG: hypothetical protein KJ882_11670 [Proteobacteria bacterium]|nr:hypothetical protein [Pseudomonadota bacterium]MBU4011409.1 hypothetical protein [Pseudomonadota bacterium]
MNTRLIKLNLYITLLVSYPLTKHYGVLIMISFVPVLITMLMIIMFTNASYSDKSIEKTVKEKNLFVRKVLKIKY